MSAIVVPAVGEPHRSARLQRLSAESFHQLAQDGHLGPGHRWMELLDGEIHDVMPVGPRHQSTVDRLNRLLHRHLGPGSLVRAQGPVHLNRYSEPLPDFAVLKHRDDFYAHRHPQPEEIQLVIEVADSSLERDLGSKARIYASAGIPEFWVVNLADETLHVFRHPIRGAYTEDATLGRAESVTASELPELHIAVADLLG